VRRSCCVFRALPFSFPQVWQYCGDRNGFGWALWTSEFCGLSSSLEQDCRRLDTRLVLILVSFSATYWHEGLGYLPDARSFPLKATLIWLVCVSVTRGTFSVTLGRGLLKRRVIVLGNGAQAARIAKLVETGENEHFVPISFIGTPGERSSVRSDVLDRSVSDPAALPDGALTEMVYRLGASEIVVATDDRRGLPVRQLLHCKLTGIKVTDFLDFLGTRDQDGRHRGSQAQLALLLRRLPLWSTRRVAQTRFRHHR